jgi:sugar fermentation stimulation protein A
MKYAFKKKLIRGLIKSRPNRFIMIVLVNNKEEKCHCPVTGNIGDIKFDNIPCLLSESENPERKTKFTVEAISLDNTKSWIGINQTKANNYIEFFLKTGQLKKIFNKLDKVEREIKFRDSRFDFLINSTDYLEIKTPLNLLLIKGHEAHSKLTSFDRIIKHFKDISKSKERIIFGLCYMYPALNFKVPKPSKSEKRIVKAAKSASKSGLETWQINMKINEQGIELLNYFKLNLF